MKRRLGLLAAAGELCLRGRSRRPCQERSSSSRTESRFARPQAPWCGSRRPREKRPSRRKRSSASSRRTSISRRICWWCRLAPPCSFPMRTRSFTTCFRCTRARASILGLYESGSSKEVRFTRPGPSYIFCNIHPEMSAVIMVMTTPYYATTDAAGDYSIEGVPPGEYEFSVWYESAQPEQLKQLQHRVTVTPTSARLDPVTRAGRPQPGGQPQEQVWPGLRETAAVSVTLGRISRPSPARRHPPRPRSSS